MRKNIIFLIFLLTINVSSVANPPDPNSADAQMLQGQKNWIERQQNNEGQRCCDIADGRGAQLRLNPNGSGNYQVFYSTEQWPNGTNQWVDVPPNTIIKQRSPIIVPIVWFYNGKVRCVALAANG